MNRYYSLIALGALFVSAWFPAPAAAACSMQITSITTCDSSGKTYAPEVGDTYYIRVNWNVTGTPNSAYSVTFTEANEIYTVTGISPSAGNGFWLYCGWPLPLDSPVPCTVTLDPDNATGAPAAGRTASYTFTPVPPATPIAYYGAESFAGAESFTVNWLDTEGSVTSGLTWLGCPTSGAYEQVLSVTPNTGAAKVVTSPAGDPVWETDYRNYTPTAGNSSWIADDTFVVSLSSVRANPTLLREATWTQLASLPSSMQPWLEPDTLVQSTSPVITQFVASVLPADYQSTMTPYDAARALFLAVVKRTTYITPAPYVDSVDIYNYQEGDCLGFSTLLNACLRAIGIPSRCICGFWQGQDQWHCLLEFYLPGCGWIPADGSQDKEWWDPTGTYSCMFGSNPFLDTFCTVGRGTSHYTSSMTATDTQVGWYDYTGTAASDGFIDSSSLTPIAPPAPPTDVAASSGPGIITVTWNGSANAMEYELERGGTSGGPYGLVSTFPSNTANTYSYVDSGRIIGKTYYYVVVAVNTTDNTKSTPTAQVSAAPQAPVPGVPANLAAVAGPGRGTMTVTWNGSANATEYELERGGTSGGPYGLVSTFPSNTANTYSYLDSGRISGKTYYYVVVAVNTTYNTKSAPTAQVSAAPN